MENNEKIMNNTNSMGGSKKNSAGNRGTQNNMENKPLLGANEKLLNTLFTTCKLSMNSIEDVITNLKNTEFQTMISDVHSKYEVISKECAMLAKAQDICLCPVDCITKFKNWAAVKIGALLDCSTSNFAKLLYGGTSCEIAEVIQKTGQCSTADVAVIELSEKLQSLQEMHIHELKKFLSAKD